MFSIPYRRILAVFMSCLLFFTFSVPVSWAATAPDWSNWNFPIGITKDSAGRVIVADYDAHVVRIFNSNESLSQILGNVQSGGSGNTQFKGPISVAVHPVTKSLHVLDRENKRIQIYGYQDTTGLYSYSSTFPLESTIQNARSISIDASGTMFVAQDNSILIIYPDQSTQIIVGSSVIGAAGDGLGNLYVTRYWEHTVAKYSLVGGSYVYQSIFAGVTGQSGNDNIHLNNPNYVFVGPDKKVYVTDSGRTQVFLPNGSLEMSLKPASNYSSAGVFADGDGILVLDTQSRGVYRYSISGDLIGRLGEVQNSTIGLSSARFDKNTASSENADIAVTMTLNGNSLQDIMKGAATLVPGTDYTISGSTVTIKKEYLAAQAVGPVNLTLVFSAGSVQALEVTVIDSTPAAPANLTATAGDGQVSLSWGGVAEVTYYTVYIGTSSDSYGGIAATVSGTTYVKTGLTNGTTYYFTVKAGNTVGQSVYSNEASATPQAVVLPELNSVHMAGSNSDAAFAKTGDTVTLTFTADSALGSVPTATIAGRTANVTAMGNNSYSASYTFAGDENEGIIPFTVDFINAAGIAGTQVTAATDNSSVIFDKTAPTGSLNVNNGAASTSSASVNLTISSSDGPGSGGVRMRFSNDNALWSNWEAAAGTKNWTLAEGHGTKTVYMELTDAAGNVTAPAITATIQMQQSSGSLEPESSSASQTENITVRVGNDGSDSIAASVVIERTTDADGQKRDKLTFTAQQAAKTVEQLAAIGFGSARIVIPDLQDEVKELNVTIPKASADLLAKGNVNLEIVTINGRIWIPAHSLQGWDDDIYFRVVPVKKEEERKEVERQARMEQIVRKVADDSDIEIVGRPMRIETNMQNRTTELVLPLGNAPFSEAQLQGLSIFIEHSDGTKELLKGDIVPYDKSGARAIRFIVNKFSTFTVLYMEGWQQSVTDKTEHKAFIDGYADGKFGPDKTITRAEMATILTRVIAKEEKTAAITYTDVTQAHWAKKAIDQATKMGLMDGYPDGRFQPEMPVTRGELASIIARLQEEATGGSGSFPDIDGHWARSAIEKVRALNLIQGYEDGTFRPDQTLTRAEAVTMLSKLVGRGPLFGAEPRWRDAPEEHWAYGYIQEASLDHKHEKRTAGGESYIPAR